MSNLKLIEMLCHLVEHQAEVIHHLSVELQHQRTLSEAEKEMVASTKDEYNEILGADEIPGDLQ